jgi:hypothetical protein
MSGSEVRVNCMSSSTKLYKMALCILQHNYLKYIGC